MTKPANNPLIYNGHAKPPKFKVGDVVMVTRNWFGIGPIIYAGFIGTISDRCSHEYGWSYKLAEVSLSIFPEVILEAVNTVSALPAETEELTPAQIEDNLRKKRDEIFRSMW